MISSSLKNVPLRKKMLALSESVILFGKGDLHQIELKDTIMTPLKSKTSNSNNFSFQGVNSPNPSKFKPGGLNQAESQTLLQMEESSPEKKIYVLYREIQAIARTPTYDAIIEKEFEDWIELIQELETEIGHEKFGLFIEFMKSLVSFFSDNPLKVKEELAVTGLKIFIKFIENATGKEGLSLEDWDADIWSSFAGKIARR